jgi:hypothetical protein
MLLDVFQSSAVDAVRRGFDKKAVADSMLTIALALLADALGKDAAAEHLGAISRSMAQGSGT